ncbi:MAG TPA: hypothetical protein VFC78_00760 [Tepidisphaeraceae bacterium]|nr:hypothetical protein [Tepidisphaeraceae bacterium]
MIRGLLLVLGMSAALLAVVVATVAIGLHRIARAQKAQDAAWTPANPAPAAPRAGAPANAVKNDPVVPQPDLIDLWAGDAQLRGNIRLNDVAAPRVHGVSRPNPRSKKKRMSQIPDTPPVTAYITGWRESEDAAVWTLNLPRAGEYEIDLTYACPKWQEGGEFVLSIGGKDLSIQTEGTRGEASFRAAALGKLTLPAGKGSLTVHPAGTLKGSRGMNLRSVEVIATSGSAEP